jgi:hypothetical protein
MSQAHMMQSPMNMPKSRIGLMTETTFAKKEIDVVAVVASVALPARRNVNATRSSKYLRFIAASLKKSV